MLYMKKASKVLTIVSCIVLALIAAAFAFVSIAVLGYGAGYNNSDGSWKRASWKSSVGWTMEHPAFEEYGEYILPWREGAASVTVPALSYYWMCLTTGWNTRDVVDGVNFMIGAEESGEAHFYKFYSARDIADEPDKADTGLIYVPGDADKPFAFVVPGGGMTSEALTAEGFTAARELHAQGYPVFIPIYRVSTQRPWEEQEKIASEDFGNAVRYIFDNAESLGVRTDGYSVWGYSAGGRLSWLWCLENEYGSRAYGVPEPAAVILSYSGWHDEQYADAYGNVPTYFGYCGNDKVIGNEFVRGIEKYIRVIQSRGVKTEVHRYENAPHGYGTGAGTEAAGWMESAYAFWQSCLS